MSSESGSSQKPPQSTIDLTSMTPMEFTVVSEPWTKYKLEDQTKLFVKLVVVKVVRGLNEQGQPAYNMNAQNIIATHLVNTSQPLVRFKVSEQVLKSVRAPIRQPDVKAPYG